MKVNTKNVNMPKFSLYVTLTLVANRLLSGWWLFYVRIQHSFR